jgi:hypothetical protein
MALNFPSSPTIGQVYTDTVSGFSYEWDGTVWRSFSPSSSSQIRALDDISSSFDNTTTTFPLTSNGTPITPASPQSLIINLGGVIQDPTDDYSVSGANLTFSTPPANGLSFSGISLGPAVPINTIPDGTVTDGSLEVNTDLLVNGDAVIAGILTVGTSSLTLDGDANTINGVTISSGIITATAFVGDYAVIAGILTVGTSSLTLDGDANTINGVIISSGIITATAFVGDELTLTGPLYVGSDPGTSGQVLKSTGTGLQWGEDFQGGGAGGAGGSGSFDTGITTSIFVSVTSGIGIGVTDTNNIFTGPGIAYSFPSTVGFRYVIESIHLTNTFGNELYISGRHDFNVSAGVWRPTPITNRVIVPYQGAAELLEEPMVANPQDQIYLQALTGTGTTESGVDGGIDAFIIYSAKTDSNYVGIGTTVTTISGQEIYTATPNQTVLQSIRLVNYNDNVDIDASVSIYRGGTVGNIVNTGVRQGYLAFNLTIPKNSTVEILEKPKYLAISDSIVAAASVSNSLAIHLAGLGYT